MSEVEYNETTEGGVHMACCNTRYSTVIETVDHVCTTPTRVGEPTKNDVYITRHAELRARISKNPETGLFEVFHPFTGEKVGSAQTLMAARVIRRRGEARKWR